MKKILFFLTVLSSTFMLFAQEDIDFNGWKKIDTEHFTFIYEDSTRITAQAYAEIADSTWNKIANIYSMPQNHLNVSITGRTNTVNALTYYSPLEIGMFTTPPSTSIFGFRTDWRELFFTHELVHAANIKFEDKFSLGSLLIGPYYKTLEFTSVPGWALEGLSTLMETELTSGGRGRSPYFELEFKAPTVENSLISYSQIGLELEPPQGQSYIMGYLIMRSIADRWGIQALADIERNRSFFTSWEDSVKLVTGYTPEEIYRDAKIALAKKYSREREIPEGITISSRKVNTNYSRPAIIFEDGSLIAVRSTIGEHDAVVKLDPAKKSGSSYYSKKNPSHNVYTETVLFEGIFPDLNCISADAEGNIYASIGTISYHKAPGITTEYSIYKWSPAEELTRITNNGTYMQPSISADGKTLIAIRQYGLTYSLVKIDVDSGEETIILQNPEFDFIQPAINADGSKVTFIAADNIRARICVKSLDDNSSDYEIVYNGTGDITDPSVPHWDGDKLIFTDNKRGRLEVFEYADGKIIPVLADPAGVLWACKNSTGIYYSTFSATGYVIKVKPVSEWGVVPDFEGPSKPGEILTFGNLESDYADFEPYALHKEEIKVRSEEIINKVKNLPESTNQISPEKPYVANLSPLLYLPLFSIVDDNTSSYKGFGAGVVWTTEKLQLNNGYILLDGLYYPEIQNFAYNFYIIKPVGRGSYGLYLDRLITNQIIDETTFFSERTSFELNFSYTLYNSDTLRQKTSLEASMNLVFGINRTDLLAFEAFSDYAFTHDFTTLYGLVYNFTNNRNGRSITLSSDLFGISLFNFNEEKLYNGFESDINISYNFHTTKLIFDADINSRYTNFPVETSVPKSLVKFNGNLLDCTYPGHTVFQLGSKLGNFFGAGAGLRVYEETYISYGRNTVDFETRDSGMLFNYTFHDLYATGIELTIASEALRAAIGYNFLTNFKTGKLSSGNFYFTIKMGSLRM